MDNRAWQTLRILSACLLAYGFAKLFALKEEYWGLITAIVVTQPILDDTLRASRNRIVGTLIGAAAGFVVLKVVQQGLPLLPLFWLALVPLAILTAIRQDLRLSCITLIVVVLIPSAGPPFERPVDRVLGILVGTMGSVIAAVVIHPRRREAKL